MNRPKHPSGRPIRNDKPKKYNFERPPQEGPLTPRLKVHKKDIDLIGFHIGQFDYPEEPT